MTGTEVTLTVKESRRLGIIEETLAGRMTVRVAAGILKKSERQVYRLRQRVRAQGAEGIRHGNRGRCPVHTRSGKQREQVIALYQTEYEKYNFTHFAETLQEKHGIRVSRETVRRWLRAEGLGRPARKMPKHRKRRLRKAHEGEMLFLDGSPHPWLGDEQSPCTLLLICDDATGKPLVGLFREQEDRDGCFLLLARLFRRYGIPQSFYIDQASQFKTTRHGGVHSLQVAQGPTEFERAMDELGIGVIYAQSPQARGRIERMNGTFQDRLVAELFHEKITTLPEANDYLNRRFIPQFAKRFGETPRDPVSVWRPWPKGADPFDVLCVKAERTVANDNTIRYNNETFQLAPAHGRHHFVQAKVEIRQRPDGTIRVVHPRLGLLPSRRIADQTACPPHPSSAIVDAGGSLGQECGLRRRPSHDETAGRASQTSSCPQCGIGSKRVSPSQGDGRG